MSGKPAARQGDMTQYGGSIVGSAGCASVPHRRGLFGAPAGDVRPSGQSAARCKGPSGETDIALPAPLPFILSAPTAVTGQKRPRRWGASAPAGKCLRISAYSCAITH
ncbi:hypothetical protein BANRA_03908 [Escherichia coli]|nr:hypothetical protein BANRA_03908 [Escherichia coli]